MKSSSGSTTSPLQWGQTFRESSERLLTNEQLRANLRGATTTIRSKRDARAAETPNWEELRDAAAAIKRYSLDHLPELLVELEEQVTRHGGIVHWARNGAEANEIAYQIAAGHGVEEVVKVKSMATQEIGLNDYFEERGINACETDLAELIVQLGKDAPSHIVVPAIHRNRTEVYEIFRATFAPEIAPASDDPQELTMAARAHLREKFLSAKVAVSGANMMIAETGALAIYESEGNGRMCLTLADVLISIVGIEKVIPTMRDAEVFTELLPRSATGEPMNPYTSWWTGVTPGDGPQEFHLILLDNGRTRVLEEPLARDALACIRCGACMNICPVYRTVGGHAYNSVYPGPIGAILTPQLLGAFEEGDISAELPYASTLCGACFDVCPVKIDIPSILVDLRMRKVEEADKSGHPDRGWQAIMTGASQVMRSGRRMDGAEAMLPAAHLLGGRSGRITALPWPVSAWTESRDIPVPPAQSYRSWMKRHEKQQKKEARFQRDNQAGETHG